jgi:hypothetical protein
MDLQELIKHHRHEAEHSRRLGARTLPPSVIARPWRFLRTSSGALANGSQRATVESAIAPAIEAS